MVLALQPKEVVQASRRYRLVLKQKWYCQRLESKEKLSYNFLFNNHAVEEITTVARGIVDLFTPSWFGNV